MVTVAEVLENPKKYDNESLADPVEGIAYGKSTAKFWFNDGNPCVNSRAHGIDTPYKLFKTVEGAELAEESAAVKTIAEETAKLKLYASGKARAARLLEVYFG